MSFHLPGHRWDVGSSKRDVRCQGQRTWVVWQWSKKVGCAVEWSKDMTLVGYEYAQAGNFLGSLIYETGEPCKTNEDCECGKCICDGKEALCIPPQ
uniref:SCP domain-containing protein n=1 Tax=Haemonchus contortus TaxID=6289 RepID=A0A7I5EB78_HAECO